MVRAVAQAAKDAENLERVVRAARSIIPRVYSVYYVESLDNLQRVGLLGKAQSILGTMLNVMPFLTIEDGELIPMEKVRSHTQAIDKLLEFVAEFNIIEKLIIVQHTLRTTRQTRILKDRLSLEFPDIAYPIMLYGPLLGSYMGPDGMGRSRGRSGVVLVPQEAVIAWASR